MIILLPLCQFLKTFFISSLSQKFCNYFQILSFGIFVIFHISSIDLLCANSILIFLILFLSNSNTLTVLPRSVLNADYGTPAKQTSFKRDVVVFFLFDLDCAPIKASNANISNHWTVPMTVSNPLFIVMS